MHVLTDHRTPKEVLSSLLSYGFQPILMPSASYLSKSVSAHPDMLLFIGFGRLFCHKKYYEENQELMNRIAELAECKLSLSDEPTGEKYPFDVLFNACLLGNRLICNTNTVSRLILAAAEDAGCEIIHVSQGYTKCSICQVSENALITSDKGIAIACQNAGIDTLTVSEGHISLPPYEYGFIGGAGGFCGNTVCFCGCILDHPDRDAIRSFCKAHGKNALSLSDEKLYDVGSLIYIGG